MITTPVDVELRIPDSGYARSEGLHQSNILRCIAAESGILKPEYVESLDLVDISQSQWWDSLSPRVKIIISMGQAWDKFYLPSLGTVVAQPGEMECDGIYMTPDGESVDFVHTSTWQGHTLAVHEAKLTYKSTKTVGDLSTQWLWIAQVKGYCKAAGTRFAFIHVLFVCGDYKFPITPQVKCWMVEFTDDELEDNWEMVTGYVRHRQRQEAEDMMRDTI